MAERVYLHIGAPKSGTTFLQTTVWSNKPLLQQAGVLLPGPTRRTHIAMAAWARTDSPSPAQHRGWTQLRSEIAAWPGNALVSCEWFTMVPDALIARLIEGLQPAEVHVVFTARSAARTLPAAWQERLKLGDSIDLADMLESMETADNERWNWATLDPSRVLPRWGKHVPHDRIHLVTLPPSGTPSSVLWTRFAQACEIPETELTQNKAFANESLTAEAARLMQLIGPQLLEEVGSDGYDKYRWIRNYLSHNLLAREAGHKIRLLPDELAALEVHTDGAIATLEAGGFDVVGDLADLRDTPDQSHAVRPSEVSDQALLALTSAVLPPVLGRLRAEYDRANRERSRANRAEESPDPSTLDTVRRRVRSGISSRLPVRARTWIRTAISRRTPTARS
ncbi:hypothetical protein [Janibacter cremeus]|uniref:Sulfotransferase family protein n=1 Tax=Janibacter cremeus TaxID=1285192 RepID=A0A852VRC8_9MICO|nr:hypothetical protein [Janibacter cremeus]NYF97990.1 hypothetical protein [Janibacter cremeus]